MNPSPPLYALASAPRGWRPHVLVAPLLTAAMLGLTFLYWQGESAAARERQRRSFDRAAEQIASNLKDRMAAYEVVLRGLKGYFDGSEAVSRTEFHAYVEALRLRETRPGLQNVSLISWVPWGQLSAHEEDVRGKGYASYRVQPGGMRGFYAPVTHIEPQDGDNLKAMGFDVATIPAAREALVRAAETGRLVLSSRLTLVQDVGTERASDAALVMYMPLYAQGAAGDGTRQGELRGWVSAPFRIKDIVRGLAREFDPDIALTIYDGSEADEARRLFSMAQDLGAPAPPVGAMRAMRQFELGGRVWTLAMSPLQAFEARVDNRQGDLLALMGVVLSLAAGWLVWMLMTARNRAEDLAQRMTQELRGARDDLDSTLSAIPDLLFEISLDERMLRYRSSRADLLAAAPEEFLGKRLADVLPPEVVLSCQNALQQALRHGYAGGWQYPLELGGVRKWFELSVARKDGALPGDPPTFIALSRDITERKEADSRTHRLAYYDALTGLPNRRLLVEHMERALERARQLGQVGALFFIDLDHFKRINDARGHAVGDALLVQVARRLQGLLRPTDTVGRLGGDEFVVLAQDLGPDLEAAQRAAQALAMQLSEALDRPYAVHGRPYSSAGSMGVTLFPRAQAGTQDMLREADTAMYRAKAQGRNRVVFFEPIMQADAQEELSLAQDLQRAWPERQFAVYVQPQVDATGALVGGELLLRWFHPERGAVPPDRFIPMAEESGLILRLGEWVLEQACDALTELASTHPALRLSVNMSQLQFRQDDFVERLQAMLERSGAPASRLVLEVTESLLIGSVDDTIVRMTRLVNMGLRFSIDDFGTGYSSFSYLKRLPLYELKIDKSFVQDTPDNPSDTAIVQSILSVARHLGLSVVAEGVETRAQADFLAASHCQGLQGYLFGRPQPLAEWLAALRQTG
ncbi:MAG: EAL domain-containing protein [Burkholderiaceae bacterium]|nr:MAG: EAL domain-containing protein [Burkholderiaceae bacterium]